MSPLSPSPNAARPRPGETHDLVLRGRIHLIQARQGYRTSVDAMLLAWFACREAPEARRVIDLGAGTGLVAITVARALPEAHATLVERQPSLGMRALRNLSLNGLEARARVVPHDLANGPPRGLGGAGLVVSNPPFYRAAGRILPSVVERRDAHYESTAPVEAFAEAAAALVAPAGKVCMVYPADQAERLVHAFANAGLGRMRLCLLHHRHTATPPTRLLLSGQLGPLDVVTLPPAQLHPADTHDHTYAPDIERFLAALPEARPLAPLQPGGVLAGPQGAC